MDRPCPQLHPHLSRLLRDSSYVVEIPFKFMYNVFYVVPRAIFHGILDVLGFRSEGIGRNEDTWASNYQSSNYGGYVPPNSFFSTYQSYGAVAANDLEINWMVGEGSAGNRGKFMTTLSYVLFICAGIVVYEGYIVRMP